jgi:ribosomal subunit interface protein
MQIKVNIKATNLELKDSLRQHVNEKIAGIEKFMNLKEVQEPIADVEVEKLFGQHHKNGEIYRAEINLQYAGRVYRTESTKEQIFVAVDDAQSEMIRRIRKSREKKSDLFRRGAKGIKRMLRFGKGE